LPIHRGGPHPPPREERRRKSAARLGCRASTDIPLFHVLCSSRIFILALAPALLFSLSLFLFLFQFFFLFLSLSGSHSFARSSSRARYLSCACSLYLSLSLWDIKIPMYLLFWKSRRSVFFVWGKAYNGDFLVFFDGAETFLTPKLSRAKEKISPGLSKSAVH
jgi:hypothetical protein